MRDIELGDEMQHYWFGDVDGDRIIPARREPADLVRRLKTIKTDIQTYRPLRWEDAVRCGLVIDRDDYLRLLREVCMLHAGEAISDQLGGREESLIQMVRMLDEIDIAVNQLTERATEWFRTARPTFTRKYRSLSGDRLRNLLIKEGPEPVAAVMKEVGRLREIRSRLVREISEEAEGVLPNMSALVGGLVAARLLSAAGSLDRLARMPASTIQVLGAGGALFSHLRSGTPPPKHGIIFQHRRVHNAPRDRRGRVARVVAARVSIAARLDRYRGAPDPAFIREAEKRIDGVTAR
ncbi:MAG: NOP5/NOP56 family protein [Methanoculleaceae archaeon]